MELRQYLQILFKNLWIIIPLTLMALTLAAIFSYSQPYVYESSSSYVASLSSAFNNNTDQAIWGLDVISGRERILVTYCNVMTSKPVLDDAFRLIGIDPTDPVITENFETRCNVLPESNVIQMLVHGPVPELVARLDQAIGYYGVPRVNRLYATFPIEWLDPVQLEEEPVSPNHIQNILLGGVLGLTMGVSLAFLLEYLRTPRERLEELSIRDADLGFYNARYFQKRLMEEISRARVRHRPLSLALLRLVPNEDFVLLPEAVQNTMLRRAGLRAEDMLRSTDLLAYVAPYTFGILLGETPSDEAYDMLDQMHDDIRTHTFTDNNYIANFTANSGVVENSGGSMAPDVMLKSARDALQTAQQTGQNSIELVRSSPRPFDLDSPVSAGAAPAPRQEAAPANANNAPFADFNLDDILNAE